MAFSQQDATNEKNLLTPPERENIPGRSDVTSGLVYTFGKKVHDLSARTYVMGILNVTPDSFSDRGQYFGERQAIKHALQMAEDGADFIDVGGESTRPGSEPVTIDEELRRVVPVIEKLAKETDIPISIDTYKSKVAEAALQAGAVVINDISGLTYDSAMAEVASRNGATVVLMHMQGGPKTMQHHPQYTDVVAEVKEYLLRQAERARTAGMSQIIIDPGIGFGKTVKHNLTLIRELRSITDLGFPVLVGPSRKSFIGAILDVPPSDRLEGTAAAVTACILNGAHIVRVHDVKQMRRVARVADEITRG